MKGVLVCMEGLKCRRFIEWVNGNRRAQRALWESHGRFVAKSRKEYFNNLSSFFYCDFGGIAEALFQGQRRITYRNGELVRMEGL